MNFCCIFGAVLKLHNKNCINNLMKLHQNCIKNDAVFKLSQNCIRHASKFRQKNTKNASKLCQHFIKSVSNLNQSCFHFQSTWLQQFNSNIIAWYSDYVSSLVKCSLYTSAQVNLSTGNPKTPFFLLGPCCLWKIHLQYFVLAIPKMPICTFCTLIKICHV